MLTHIRNLLISKSLISTNRYFLLSSLFKKRNQAQQQSPKINPQPSQNDKEIQREQEDAPMNFFERRRQMDTSFDFTKLKNMATDNIPEDLGKGGLQEVIYWSQSAITPQQINHVLSAFNKTAENNPESLKKLHFHQVQVQAFHQKASASIHLINNLETLRQYAVYGYKYDNEDDDFWDKLQFKACKFFPKSQKQYDWLIDIGFIMGQFKIGAAIYNHVSKFLQDQQMNIDQYVKLYLTFFMLKLGEKPWIDKLLKGISTNLHQADTEQLTSILPALKQVKSLPEDMDKNIESRALELIDNFSLTQITSLMHYFGFEHKNQTTWKILENKLQNQLNQKQIDTELLQHLILKVMPTYNVSTEFIQQNIIRPIQESKLSVLNIFPVSTLSILSKGLYIYELENQTKHIQVELSRLVIGKMTKEISDLSDSEVLKVIQDYNLTRNGSRQLYIFFEEVIRIRYLRGFDAQTDRHTIQLLIEIYGNSGMCSRDMYEALQSLILE